jgi:hypothetical protein
LSFKEYKKEDKFPSHLRKTRRAVDLEINEDDYIAI